MKFIASQQFQIEIGGDRSVLRLQSLAAAIGLAVGLLILIGYAAEYEPAWRLSRGLPATHPVSALCIALLGFALCPDFSKHPIVRLVARAAVLVATAVLLLRLLTPWMGMSLFNAITPFRGVLASQAAAGTPITMGTNTAQTLLVIAASELLRWKPWPVASQLLGCCAMALLFVALTGYIDTLPTFHGTLAPLTLLGAVSLATSVLCATHQGGFIRPLVARSAPGRLARLLLGWSTPVVLLIGWIVSHYTHAYGMTPEAGALLAYQTAAIIILSWVLVTAATVRADVIDRRRDAAEALLLNAAATDALTGLLSRNKLELHRVAGERGRPGITSAELFIDLDRFRAVNEAFGHAIGDEFLMEIGQRLQSVGHPHAVGRLGGDEFAIYCSAISLAEAERIGFAVTSALAMPFTSRGRSFRLTVSVGVSHSDAAGDIDLRAAADSAMHVAKRRGGNQVVTFHGSMYEERRAKIELEQYLHAALEQDNELSLAYQPVLNVIDQSLVSVEALARWTHPQLGAISPERFIKLAEATGLIVPLGLKLMATAVAQAGIWRDQYGARAPRINLNISPIQFANGDVIADLKHMLDRHDLTTNAICIEVTEGAFSDTQAINCLEKARDMGFTVAMDDFGVGYSSLGQLPRLPVTTVKLDRSFIVDCVESAGGAIMLESIVQLAHGLKLKVVAEGVESAAQLALVARVGCDAVQGYIYAKPMDAAEFRLWLTERPYSQAVA
jgi:diguanylate cyclase (GGDEF)-like protein